MKKELYEQIYQIEQTHWWYVARREIIFDWMRRNASVDESQHILDVGCGTGFNIEYLQSQGYSCITGLDISAEALHFCKLRQLPNLICGNGALSPFADGSFDYILALDLLEHLEHDQHAICELVRILKPDGKLFLFVPANQFLWGLQDEVSHHFRRYNKINLKELLLKTNLHITKLTYVNTFLFPAIWLGRSALRLLGDRINIVSENDLSPGWLNSIFLKIFLSEKRIIRRVDMPFGVSIYCIAQKVH